MQPGWARFAVRRVSITTNNVTYALFGERMSYWQFFPSPQEGWGVVPVWGFAEVVDSAQPDIAVGARYFGYWPLADTVDLLPTKVSPSGFIDGAAHRAAIAVDLQPLQRCAIQPGGARMKRHWPSCGRCSVPRSC